jgi:GntR family transcriptional regulator
MPDPNAFFLSNSDPTPMYAQIVEQVTAKVLAGDWRTGQPIPSIRQLASASKVSVITVKRAYLELERAGVIVTRAGKGSFVADSLDLARQMAAKEFRFYLDGMLVAADRLGMGLEHILSEVEQEVLARETTMTEQREAREAP